MGCAGSIPTVLSLAIRLRINFRCSSEIPPLDIMSKKVIADGGISEGLESLQLSHHALRETNSDGNVEGKPFDFLIYSSQQST